MKREIAKRWALLTAKLISDGKMEIAADVVATFQLRRVQAKSEIKQFSVPDADVPVLDELREMLDELGYENVMKMGEKRRKELERGRPGIYIPVQNGTL